MGSKFQDDDDEEEHYEDVKDKEDEKEAEEKDAKTASVAPGWTFTQQSGEKHAAKSSYDPTGCLKGFPYCYFQATLVSS